MNELSLPDQCMVHRYLYYVLNRPIISDYAYDQLEKQALVGIDENHPLNRCGSDSESSYSDEIKLIAKKIVI